MNDVRTGMSTRQAFGLGAALVIAGSTILVGPSLLGRDVLPPCAFRTLTGWDCPFCGGTRATRSLLTGDVGAAFDHNALVPLAAVLLVGVGVWWLLARTTDTVDFAPVRRALSSRALWIGLLVLLLVFWLVRNLPLLGYLASPSG